MTTTTNTITTTRTTSTLFRRLCETCGGAHQRPLEQADESPFLVGLACAHCDKVASDLYLANLALEDAAREARHQRTLRRAGDIDEDEVNAIQSECLCDDTTGFVCSACETDGVALPAPAKDWCLKCGAPKPEGEQGWTYKDRTMCPPCWSAYIG